MEIVCLPSRFCEKDKPKSAFAPDKNLIYVQPPRPIKQIARDSGKRASSRFESETTYSLSYMYPGVKIRSKKPVISDTRKVDAKIDSKTVTKMSYEWRKAERAKTCYPASRLGCGEGPMEKESVHASSYMEPGHVRTKSAREQYNRRPVTASMETSTIARESYQNPGTPSKRTIIGRSADPYGKLSFSPDYDTVHKSSYQLNEIRRPKIVHLHQKTAKITTPVDCETIYKTSYMIPGHFVRIN